MRESKTLRKSLRTTPDFDSSIQRIEYPNCARLCLRKTTTIADNALLAECFKIRQMRAFCKAGQIDFSASVRKCARVSILQSDVRAVRVCAAVFFKIAGKGAAQVHAPQLLPQLSERGELLLRASSPVMENTAYLPAGIVMALPKSPLKKNFTCFTVVSTNSITAFIFLAEAVFIAALNATKNILLRGKQAEFFHVRINHTLIS